MCALEANYVKTWAKNDQAKAKGIEIQFTIQVFWSY